MIINDVQEYKVRHSYDLLSSVLREVKSRQLSGYDVDVMKQLESAVCEIESIICHVATVKFNDRKKK